MQRLTFVFTQNVFLRQFYVFVFFSISYFQFIYLFIFLGKMVLSCHDFHSILVNWKNKRTNYESIIYLWSLHHEQFSAYESWCIFAILYGGCFFVCTLKND